MKNKLLLTTILSYIWITCFSQINNHNPSQTFLLRLYQDQIISFEKTTQSLIILDSISIDINTLKPYKLFNRFEFYKFELGNNKVTNKSSHQIFFNSTYCKKYILAMNIETGESYRIQGFKGNDLIFLIKELQVFFPDKKPHEEALKYLTNISREINIMCIYKATIKMDFECPCLKPCSDEVPLH